MSRLCIKCYLTVVVLIACVPNFAHASSCSDLLGKNVNDLSIESATRLTPNNAYSSELNTTSIFIASAIYREFGYEASKVNLAFQGGSTVLQSKFRQLRLLAAYLNHPTVLLQDRGGALGALPDGTSKQAKKIDFRTGALVDDVAFSSRVGGFTGWQSIDRILSEVNVNNLPEYHPWRNLTKEDVSAFLTLMEKFTPQAIEGIVRAANYSNVKDEVYMIKALRYRRLAFIEGLREIYFPYTSSLANLGQPKPTTSGANISELLRRSNPSDQERNRSISLTRIEEQSLGKYVDDSVNINRYLWNEYDGTKDLSNTLIGVIDEVLAKLPNHKGTVFRAPLIVEWNHGHATFLYDKYLESLKVGKTVIEKGFVSTTVFGDGEGLGWSIGESPIVLIIESKTGKNIAPFSQRYTEGEVLFGRGTKFKVLSKEYDTGLQKWFIRMAEEG